MRGRESSGIDARCCDVLRSVTVGALSFAVAPGYGGWESPWIRNTVLPACGGAFSRASAEYSRTAGRAPAEYMPHTRRIPAECAPTTCAYCTAARVFLRGAESGNTTGLPFRTALLCCVYWGEGGCQLLSLDLVDPGRGRVDTLSVYGHIGLDVVVICLTLNAGGIREGHLVGVVALDLADHLALTLCGVAAVDDVAVSIIGLIPLEYDTCLLYTSPSPRD